MTWNNAEFNAIFVPLLVLLTTLHLLTSPLTYFVVSCIFLYALYILKKFPKYKLDKAQQLAKAYVNEPWRFTRTFLQSIMFVYLMKYYAEDDIPEERTQLVSIAVFLAYMRLLSYLRLIPKYRKQIAQIIYVMKKSFVFYVILMIYIIATTFATMALRNDDDFRANFQLAYRMAFADFEDDYPTTSEIIGFLVSSFFGPLLMLNLLIAIMSDAHEE